jgi:hypothetical protein
MSSLPAAVPIAAFTFFAGLVERDDHKGLNIHRAIVVADDKYDPPAEGDEIAMRYRHRPPVGKSDDKRLKRLAVNCRSDKLDIHRQTGSKMGNSCGPLPIVEGTPLLWNTSRRDGQSKSFFQLPGS